MECMTYFLLFPVIKYLLSDKGASARAGRLTYLKFLAKQDIQEKQIPLVWDGNISLIFISCPLEPCRAVAKGGIMDLVGGHEEGLRSA
jgi:hypothetical protein